MSQCTPMHTVCQTTSLIAAECFYYICALSPYSFSFPPMPHSWHSEPQHILEAALSLSSQQDALDESWSCCTGCLTSPHTLLLPSSVTPVTCLFCPLCCAVALTAA